MASNIITVKLDPETSALMLSVTDHLIEVEKLLGQIGELFKANLSEGLMAEITPPTSVNVSVAELGEAVQREGENFIRSWRSRSVPSLRQSPIDSSERLG